MAAIDIGSNDFSLPTRNGPAAPLNLSLVSWRSARRK